jgi:hypothetical protein
MKKAISALKKDVIICTDESVLCRPLRRQKARLEKEQKGFGFAPENHLLLKMYRPTESQENITKYFYPSYTSIVQPVFSFFA